MFSKTKRVHAPAQYMQIQVPDPSSPLNIRLIMQQVLSEYSHRGPEEQYLIQFWQCSSSKGSRANGFDVTTKDQPFRIPQFNVHLDRYRQRCVDKGSRFVELNTRVGSWLVGRAVQKRLADQGTIRADGSHNQKLWLFVMPVLLDWGTYKQTVGVIELVTLVPKASYGEDFDRINNLLKDLGENESLESGEMGKMIKVEYKKMCNPLYPEEIEFIKFPLSFSAKLKDLKTNVVNRIEPRTFSSIGYKDTDGIYHRISSDHDLKVCIQKSISTEAAFIKMAVNLEA